MNITDINLSFERATPEEIVKWALENFNKRLVLTSSFDGDSAVMLHMVTRIIPDIPVIFIDTGESPNPPLLDEMAKYFDLNLFVCKANGSDDKAKVLNRAMQSYGIQGWISGVRSDQTLFRSTLETVTQRGDGIYKIHPILEWTDNEIGLYLKMWDLPFNPSQEIDRPLRGECGIHTSCGDGDKI